MFTGSMVPALLCLSKQSRDLVAVTQDRGVYNARLLLAEGPPGQSTQSVLEVMRGLWWQSPAKTALGELQAPATGQAAPRNSREGARSGL